MSTGYPSDQTAGIADATYNGVSGLPSHRRDSGVRILIFGVSSLLQEGLQAVLSRERDFTVVGVSRVGNEASRLVKRLSPDVIMIGPELADIPALKLIMQLSDANPEIIERIAVFGKFEQADTIIKLLRAGVCAFFEEDIISEALIVRLRQFVQGQPVLGHSTIKAIQWWCGQRDAADGGDHRAAAAKLSAQERRVLDLMAQGMSTAAIATTLRLSETTVRSHVHRMKLKLNLSTRDKLIGFAIRCAERREPPEEWLRKWNQQ